MSGQTTAGETRKMNEEPKILGLLCRWCSYAGADLAGTSRFSYPPNVRIVQVGSNPDSTPMPSSVVKIPIHFRPGSGSRSIIQLNSDTQIGEV